MKSIATAAMAAIEAGEALVTGAVEIFPRGIGSGVAVNVAATSFTGTLASRTRTLAGYATTDTVTLSKPQIATDSRLSWNAWSAWPADNSTTPLPPPVVGQTWNNGFSVYGNNGGSDVLLFAPMLDSNLYATEAEAFAALAAQLPLSLTGYSTYKVVVPTDATPLDNRNGVSLLFTTEADPADPIRLWGGYGSITLDGNVYLGLGDRAFAQQTAGALGGVAQGLTIGLSGIEPNALPLIETAEIAGAPCVIHRLIFASDGKTLLGYEVWDRGKVDTVATDEQIGASASIGLAVESAARGLGHSGARQRADSDQRLISASDGYFKNTAFAGQKELYWGGKIPVRTGDAHGGVVAGTSGGTGAGF